MTSGAGQRGARSAATTGDRAPVIQWEGTEATNGERPRSEIADELGQPVLIDIEGVQGRRLELAEALGRHRANAPNPADDEDPPPRHGGFDPRPAAQIIIGEQRR